MSENKDGDDLERKTRKAPAAGSGSEATKGVSFSLTAKERRKILSEDQAKQSTEAICQMYLQGYSFMEIAKVVQLSSVLVRETVEESRKIWLERHDRALSDLVAEQVAKIDRVESRAWESYELSRETTSESIDATGSNDKGAWSSVKKIRKKQTGSADFLHIILSCVKQRTDLLGLSKRSEEDAIRHNSMLVVVNTPEEARAIQNYQEFQKLVDGSVVSQEEPVE